MSRIIEFIGPPGVGKSTIYNELIKSYRKNSNWAPKDYFLPKTSNARLYNSNYWIILARKILNKPVFDTEEINLSAYEFLEENPQFISLCWNLIDKNRRTDHLGVDQRFRSAYHLFSVFGIFQSIKDSNDPRICITDELLIHRIIQVTKEFDYSNHISRFVQHVPIPKSLVLFDAPADVLVKRIRNRNRRVLRYESRKTNEMIELAEFDKTMFKIAAKKLRERGVEILLVDTHINKVKACIEIIIDFLNKN